MCDSTLGARVIAMLIFSSIRSNSDTAQHQVRIIVIVTTSFYDDELSTSCMMGILVISTISMTEVACIRTVDEATGLK